MPPVVLAIVLILAAYLVGSIPIGYLVGRMKGVNLFHVGSGNIGATNVGRVLGRKFGVAVFVLDFLKGALPVALIEPLARSLNPDAEGVFSNWDGWRVGAAVAAFLGHLFPIYLGFRGGKGVATGAGTVVVLVPGPSAVALLVWVTAFTAFRFVSLASILAVAALVSARLLSVANPFASESLAPTLYCLIGSLVVVIKHRSNIRRLANGTEDRKPVTLRGEIMLKAIHVLAIGLWFGSGVFFNFVAAVPIFDSFKAVVAESPSDRTAYVPIVPEGTTTEKRAELASALAGAAVGPLFPRFFILSAVCSVIVLLSVFAWRSEPGGANKWRLILAVLAVLLVAVGWYLSVKVTELRTLRFHSDASIASTAKEAFGPWHAASLIVTSITTLVTGVLMLLASMLPNRKVASSPPVAAA